MSSNSSHLIGDPDDLDDDLEIDDEQRAWYLRWIQDRQSKMTFEERTTTPPRRRQSQRPDIIIPPRIPLATTDTPLGPIIEGEARLASFRKKAERANRWVTGSQDVVDLLTGYPNLPGNLEAAHAAPRDTGYRNWSINRSVESILGLNPASLHYDTISNGFMVFILVHKIYDNGFAFILPTIEVTQEMEEITQTVGKQLALFQLRLNNARNLKNFDDAAWRKEELELRIWARSQWQDFDDNHARHGTYYHVYPTSLAIENPYAHQTPIPQLRTEEEGGDIIARYPWRGLQKFLCHVHPRFFLIDSIFKKLEAPLSSSMEDFLMFTLLKKLWTFWTVPSTEYFNEEAMNVLTDRYTTIQSRLRPVIRSSLPKPALIPSTPNPLPAAPSRNTRMPETILEGREEDEAEDRDEEDGKDDMHIEQNEEVEDTGFFGVADDVVEQAHRSSSPDELDSIWVD